MRPSRNAIVGLLVALIFFAANVYSYLRMPSYSTIDDGFVYFGWPFSIYMSGGFATISVIVWTGVVGNVFIALCVYRVIQRLFKIGRIGSTSILRNQLCGKF